MQRVIKSMEAKCLQPSLDLVEDVFTRWDSAEEGKTVRRLVEEIRSKKYYLPDDQRTGTRRSGTHSRNCRLLFL